MESLQVRTGQVCLQILDDAGEPRGIFKFNPEDINSAKAFLELQQELEAKQADFEERVKTCTEMEQQVNLLQETVSYLKGLVDRCFGEGSSNIVFGNACTLSMFVDFFDGITPYYEKATKNRLSKYEKKKK